MLRMHGFAYHPASTAEEAVRLHAQLPDAHYIAGGTDLLPNVKHRIVQPKHLIGIGEALGTDWRRTDDAGAPGGVGWIVIGGGARLADIAAGLDDVPALQQAAGLVAGPQIRNMGTIGGNILLDTRCLYYNQTAFWREALGYCLKAEGSLCHVIGSERTCVAAQSSDCVPVLLALDARIVLLSATGPRTVAMRDLYQYNGMDHLCIESGELLTEVHVPRPMADARGVYQKLRRRGSIDFPQLGIAITGRFEGTGEQTIAHQLDIVIGAINPQPKPLRKLDPYLGTPLTDAICDQIAALAQKQSRPNEAVIGDTSWRRDMAGVFARRALDAIRQP